LFSTKSIAMDKKTHKKKKKTLLTLTFSQIKIILNIQSLKVRLGKRLNSNSNSSLLFSTYLKNKLYFIQLFQILSHKVKPRNSCN
jgi:hypothetical protein